MRKVRKDAVTSSPVEAVTEPHCQGDMLLISIPRRPGDPEGYRRRYVPKNRGILVCRSIFCTKDIPSSVKQTKMVFK